MLGFLALGSAFTLLIVIVGTFAWRRTGPAIGKPGNQRRHRAEARQWQTRFQTDEDFARNFQRPTQNEVLETLQMLDHLSPNWDHGDAALVDRRLKNELAESFPTLRKGECVYPQAIAEDALRLFGAAKLSRPALEMRLHNHHADIARARQELRAEQAQAAARLQLTSGADTGPAALDAGSLPFRVSEEVRSNRAGPVIRWLGLAMAALVLAACGWYFTKPPCRAELTALFTVGVQGTWTAHHPVPVGGTPTPVATPVPTASIPTAASEARFTETHLTSSPSATAGSAKTESIPVVAESPPATPVVASSPGPAAAEAVLAERIAESKMRAVDKHPDLAVPNSEVNLRFVFRYKTLVAEKSPRLQDPEWPEKLAEECAEAAEAGSKGNRPTQAGHKPR